MRDRKTQKHKQYRIEEKNQIVLLYLDHQMGRKEILRTYGIANDSGVSIV